VSKMGDRFVDFRVLLVEDDPQSMNLIRSMLNDLGIFQVFSAENGARAMSLLEEPGKRNTINVILCDWNMPVLSGIDLLRYVRTGNPGIPFLMITGQADEESVKEARAEDVTGFIRKPFTREELRRKLRVIQSVLEIRAR